MITSQSSYQEWRHFTYQTMGKEGRDALVQVDHAKECEAKHQTTKSFSQYLFPMSSKHSLSSQISTVTESSQGVGVAVPIFQASLRLNKKMFRKEKRF
jgi:hypothetical protein